MKHLVYSFLSLFFLFHSAPGHASDAPAGQAITGSFQLIQKTDRVWVASYNLDEAVDFIRLDRTAWAYQQQAWHFPDDDIALEYRNTEHGLKAIIKRKSGKTLKGFTIEVTEFQALPEKDYYAFSGFTGGGMSVYAGYFMGTGIRDSHEKGLKLSASYMPLDQHVVITRNPDALANQFVYFGPKVAEQMEFASLIIDKAMPVFISDRTKHAFPVVSEALSKIFSFKPKGSYQVFIAGAGLDQGDGYSSKGGALDGQLLFTYKGKGVVKYEREHPEHLPVFVAHEVFHLFQKDLWPRLGDKHPWMHEGIADALALALMFQEGEITRAIFRQQKEKIRSGCLNALPDVSVDGGPDNARWDIVYDCGATIHWLLADALTKKDADLDIFEVWRTMAAQSKETREQDGKVLYYQVLRSMGVSVIELKSLDHFLAHKADDPAKALNALEQAFGL